jgi:hypothetical protein
LRSVLISFGFKEEDLPEEIFSTEGDILTFVAEPARVDLLNEIEGVDFAEAKPECVQGNYGDVRVSFIGRRHLIQNKRASARPQDSVAAAELERLTD